MIDIERNRNISLFGGVDKVALALYIAIVVIGFFAIVSATWVDGDENPWSFSHDYIKQLIWIGVSWAIGLGILLTESSIWHKCAYFTYIIAIIMLIVTLAVGKEVNGAKAWLGVGGAGIQTMEFAKVAIALATARFMSGYSFSIERVSDIIKVGILLFIPLVIVVLQNDTGSGVVLCSFLFMMYREGLNKWLCISIVFVGFLFIISFLLAPTTLAILIILAFTFTAGMMNKNWGACIKYISLVGLVSLVLFLIGIFAYRKSDIYHCILWTTLFSLIVVAIYAYIKNIKNLYLIILLCFVSLTILPTSSAMFNGLRAHQQDRIKSYLGIEADPKNDYNVNQAKIAIGSGGFIGKGYLKGSQIRYGFVPERHTDFIFCTIGEEWGFVGSIVVLAIIFWFILRLIRIAERQPETFGRVYCYCVASIFLFHTVVNVGMNIGIVPVMGIPLPMISYGGSSLCAFTIMVFIALALDASTADKQIY